MNPPDKAGVVRLEMIQKAINAQAEDQSLWFHADHITEAYIQQSLRWLHRVIEDGDERALNSILEQAEDHR